MMKLLARGFAFGLAMTAGAVVASNAYLFVARPEITSFPAVVVQPQSQGVMAFDVLPKGRPAENADNGYAWHDTCGTDLILYPNDPVSCARMGVKSDRIEIGERAFQGAAPRPVHIIQGGQTRMIIDASGVRVIGNLRVTGTINP